MNRSPLCCWQCGSFRRSVNDVRTGRRWLFHHGRVYAEKTWRTAQSSIFRISRAGLYQSWGEKRLWIPKVICVRQISSILLQTDLIFHRSITLKWLSTELNWPFTLIWTVVLRSQLFASYLVFLLEPLSQICAWSVVWVWLLKVPTQMPFATCLPDTAVRLALPQISYILCSNVFYTWAPLHIHQFGLTYVGQKPCVSLHFVSKSTWGPRVLCFSSHHLFTHKYHKLSKPVYHVHCRNKFIPKGTKTLIYMLPPCFWTCVKLRYYVPIKVGVQWKSTRSFVQIFVKK